MLTYTNAHTHTHTRTHKHTHTHSHSLHPSVCTQFTVCGIQGPPFPSAQPSPLRSDVAPSIACWLLFLFTREWLPLCRLSSPSFTLGDKQFPQIGTLSTPASQKLKHLHPIVRNGRRGRTNERYERKKKRQNDFDPVEISS